MILRKNFQQLSQIYSRQIFLKENLTTDSTLGMLSAELEPGKKEEGYNFYPSSFSQEVRKRKRRRKAVNKRPAKGIKNANWAGKIIRRPQSPPGL